MAPTQSEIKPNKKDWTETGVDCHYSGATCEICPIYQMYGLHKDHPEPRLRCHQPQANQALLAKGLSVPKQQFFEKDGNFLRSRERPSNAGRQLEKEGAELRAEVVRLLPTLEEPTLYGIATVLNGVKFLGKEWGYDRLNNHFMKMRAAGVIRMTHKDQKNIVHYVVEDASKLKGMLRSAKPFRKKEVPLKRHEA